eukprot:COSAG01_NODE_312_length_19063_cov_207.879825_19_plen_137_part_00
MAGKNRRQDHGRSPGAVPSAASSKLARETGAIEARCIEARCSRYCNISEAPWLVNGGHGASLRHHNASLIEARCIEARWVSTALWVAGGWRARRLNIVIIVERHEERARLLASLYVRPKSGCGRSPRLTCQIRADH